MVVLCAVAKIIPASPSPYLLYLPPLPRSHSLIWIQPTQPHLPCRHVLRLRQSLEAAPQPMSKVARNSRCRGPPSALPPTPPSWLKSGPAARPPWCPHEPSARPHILLVMQGHQWLICRRDTPLISQLLFFLPRSRSSWTPPMTTGLCCLLAPEILISLDRIPQKNPLQLQPQILWFALCFLDFRLGCY
jgi:hypothetical protein